MFVVIAIIVSALLVGLDQFTKYLAVEYLANGDYVTVIDKVLRFRYVENTGAVFGSFSNHTGGLTIFSTLLVVVLGAVLLFVGRKGLPKFMNFCFVLMLSGGIGNIIDRIRLGYVIDFIEPVFVNFAVFNFADCLITVSAFLVVGYLLYGVIKDAIRVKNKYKDTTTPVSDGASAEAEKDDGAE